MHGFRWIRATHDSPSRILKSHAGINGIHYGLNDRNTELCADWTALPLVVIWISLQRSRSHFLYIQDIEIIGTWWCFDADKSMGWGDERFKINGGWWSVTTMPTKEVTLEEDGSVVIYAVPCRFRNPKLTSFGSGSASPLGSIYNFEPGISMRTDNHFAWLPQLASLRYWWPLKTASVWIHYPEDETISKVLVIKLEDNVLLINVWMTLEWRKSRSKKQRRT